METSAIPSRIGAPLVSESAPRKYSGPRRNPLAVEMEHAIREAEASYVPLVIARIREIALHGAAKDAVPAAKVYLGRVMGPERAPEDVEMNDRELEAAVCGHLGITVDQLESARASGPS